MVSKNMLIKMLISAILISLCIPLDSIDIFLNAVRYSEFSIDIHYFWMNSITFAGIFGAYFISVLAAIPYADRFCVEYQEGIWRTLIFRWDVKKYLFFHVINAFWIGGVTAFLGGAAFIVSAQARWNLFDRNRYIEVTFLPFSELLKNNPGNIF